jgi:hypothetical protein
MSYVVHKIIKKRTYAYEITAIWDAKLKRSKNKSKYLGIVDKNTNKICKFIKKPSEKERFILDFGDGYFLFKFIESSDLYKILKSIFSEKCFSLLLLLIYRLCTQSAMYNCKNWVNGNVVSILFKDTDISSQRISDILFFLSQEEVQRSFFVEYLKLIGGCDKSVIIDTTSMHTSINHEFNAWGRSDGKIDTQFKLLCVVDQNNKTPLFYRFLPGNLTDVNTIQTTILELQCLGVKNSFAMFDAGFFSEENIRDLYKRKIEFLTRLPSGRLIFKEIISNKISDIETLNYEQVIGTRGVFVKTFPIELYNNKAHAYVILDPKRRAKEREKLLLERKNEPKRNEDDDKKSFDSAGVMILISSKHIPETEVLSCYYLRQSIEQIFSFSKSDLGLLPIRHHNDETIRGYLFLQFLLLIFFIRIREKIFDQYTVEQAMIILQKLKCKVFDNQIIPTELTADHKSIFEKFNILVPKNLGI